MGTTTIRLPADLKARAASAAECAEKTTYSFILEAKSDIAELDAQRAHFDEEADARYARIVESGKTLPWTDVRHYLEDRLAGHAMT